MTSLRLVLASRSPRRRELLERIGLHPIVEPAELDETVRPAESPTEYVHRLATAKATARAAPATIVVAADTTVVIDGDILGKPTDRRDADAMIRRLADRAHEVLTGVAVIATDGSGRRQEAAGVERSIVRLAPLTAARRAWYLATGEPDDKAGGYALQGAAALFADHVEGSVSNVIGLPLPLLDRLCDDVGVDLLDLREDRP